MSVPDLYFINDTRKTKDFNEKTFCGYLRKDVLNAFQKSILNYKIENACNWTTELIISGQLDKVWDRIINIFSKNININNPLLPNLIYRRLDKFINICKDTKYKNNIIELRNNQSVRNMLCELIIILTTSTKGNSINLIKIPNDNFNINNIKNKFIIENNKVKSNKIVDEIYDINDPKELKIIFTQLTHSLETKYEYALFWLSWILEWEKLNIKKYKKYICGYRNIKGIDKKYHTEIVWIIWEIILKNTIYRDIDLLNTQIQSLYKIFKFGYSSKKNRRIHLIIHSIKLLTDHYNLNMPLDCKRYITIQATSKINMLYKEKKKYENKEANYLDKLKYSSKIDAFTINDEKNKILSKPNTPETKKQLDKKKNLEITVETNKKFETIDKIDNIILKRKTYSNLNNPANINSPNHKPKIKQKTIYQQNGNELIEDIETIFSN